MKRDFSILLVRAHPLLLIAVIIFLLFSCSSIPADNATSSSSENISVIQLADGVSGEMLSSQFWCRRTKNPSKVRMSLSEIGLFNRENEKILFPLSASFYIVTDLRKVDSYLSSSEIRSDMARYSSKTTWYKKVESKKGGEIYALTKKDWKNLQNLMNYAPLEEEGDFPVRKAICVKRATLRQVPDDNFYSDDENYWYDDYASVSGILMNEPVLVLWESKNKNYFYVKTSFCTGWIKAENIAFCSDEEFERYFDWTEKNQRSFVTITEERYTLLDDYVIDFEKIPVSGAEKTRMAEDFYLGTYLFTCDWTDGKFEDAFSERRPYAAFLVEIPYRKEDGSLGKKYASLPAGACSLGLLPYTGENVLNLAFKMLGNRYGWGGMAKNRDCSEFLKDIYRCFGFNLPRNSRAELSVAGKTLDFEGKSVAKKESLLSSLEAPTLLGFPGHVFMYLGNFEGKNYVLSALGSYYEEAAVLSEVKYLPIYANSVSINTLEVRRKTGETWADLLSKAKLFLNDGTFFDERISLNPHWQFAEFSKINSGKAVLYKAGENRKNITVAVNAGHGTRGGDKIKTYSHPDKSPKVTGGTTGIGAVESIALSGGMIFSDGKSEAEVNLRLAHLFKNQLLRAGFDVLMLRDSFDTQLDNIARTVLANNNARIHIAIHFDSDNQKEDKGCFYCSIPDGIKNLPNVKKHWKESERLGDCLTASLQKNGFKLYGKGRLETDLTQTSYSTIPTVDIELGNQHSDTDTESLKKRAKALCEGLVEFYAKKM